MIKKFKLYENYWLLRKGEYALLKSNYSKYYPGKFFPDTKVLILSEYDGNSYKVQFHTGTWLYLPPGEIARRLTPKEIEEFEAKKMALKYNL